MNDSNQTVSPTRSPKPWGIRTALLSVYLDRFSCFQGRAGRKEFWYAVLPTVAFIIASTSVLHSLPDSLGKELLEVLLLLAVLFVLTPWIALIVRRLHDMGLSGWYALILVVPWVGRLFILVCALFPSEGPNKWGRSSETSTEW